MKFTKISLIAAMLIGSSAFAIDNVKVSGDANLYYQSENTDSNKIFNKDSSSTDTSLNLNVTADLIKNDSVTVSGGAGYSVLSTLGLENNLVSKVWGGSHTATIGNGSTYGNKVETANWVNEAWIAATSGKTTAKIGRMELDTPLAFTEKWTIERNTFEAAMVVNQDIPNTTLVGGYIGNGNGTETNGQNLNSNVSNAGLATAAVVNANGDFATYGTDGAYVAGIVNNSYKPLTAQAWYYDITKVATAYWLQADLKMSGVSLGAQYSSTTKEGTNVNDDNVWAALLGYEMANTSIALSYSSVNDNGSLGYAGANTATATGTAQTKLYTEAWWNYGQVTQTSTNSMHLTVESSVKDVADFGLYVTSIDHTSNNTNPDLTELTLTASKSLGNLDATLAYIHTNMKNNPVVNNVQAYLTYSF